MEQRLRQSVFPEGPGGCMEARMRLRGDDAFHKAAAILTRPASFLAERERIPATRGTPHLAGFPQDIADEDDDLEDGTPPRRSAARRWQNEATAGMMDA